MDIILWRHAEAEEGSPDLARQLTPKGEQQAARMAAWLKQHMPANMRILVSPAKRTQQTALALGMEFTTLDELAPGASPQVLLDAAGWPLGKDNVLIVGHQPTLGMAAAYAMTRRTQYWSVKKGAVWWITHRRRGEEEQTVLRAMLTPELV
ncbi:MULTISPECIES: SixA phosphatase family protein [Methylobacillus]|uniref:Phosphohistidine phosphatase, SixA n=1 Tax=Methylobacillus flagellatus (strain ATCC 51484 / DSM 6875 / VKM B-1610 / KT) TaxID=265072 RepID=Q1GZK3_METFK|nr:MULTISPECIES: histidine phosphatase family protein [Methylobacillus]ABE50334.1 phosphohistidine phosphatase, SixA [Methylobacillus flagellatus KT]MPS48317.1 histidine phosphatase family protein [Methylobacillus sp.]